MSISEETANLIRAAFGAPGDWGYGTKKGEALFALYKEAARGGYFYFQRKSEPRPAAEKWLTSGVVLAASAQEAQKKLGALLEAQGLRDLASDFSFVDLGAVKVEPHGVAVVTIESR